MVSLKLRPAEKIRRPGYRSAREAAGLLIRRSCDPEAHRLARLPHRESGIHTRCIQPIPAKEDRGVRSVTESHSAGAAMRTCCWPPLLDAAWHFPYLCARPMCPYAVAGGCAAATHRDGSILPRE